VCRKWPSSWPISICRMLRCVSRCQTMRCEHGRDRRFLQPCRIEISNVGHGAGRGITCRPLRSRASSCHPPSAHSPVPRLRLAAAIRRSASYSKRDPGDCHRGCVGVPSRQHALGCHWSRQSGQWSDMHKTLIFGIESVKVTKRGHGK